jgi:hypothetical protein
LSLSATKPETRHLDQNEPRYVRLNRRRVIGLTRGVTGAAGSHRIELHPQSGRNTLYLLHGNDGRSWLAKIDGGQGESLECLAHLALGATAFAKSPILVVAPARLCLFEFEHDAQTLEGVARSDLHQALEMILDLGTRALPMMRTPAPSQLLPRRALIDFPIPHAHQVLDASRGFLEVVRAAQDANLLSRIRFNSNSQMYFSHGDIKLDNILCSFAGPLLIDFDACCLAPAGADTAAFVGCMLVATIRARQTIADFRPALLHAAILLSRLRADLIAHDNPSIADADFDMMLAVYLIERALSEAHGRHTASPTDLLLIELARAIVEHGLLGLIRAAH